MGDVVGVLLGSMRRDQLEIAKGLIELLDCQELHLLMGNPIDVPCKRLVVHGYPTPNQTDHSAPTQNGARANVVVALHSSPLDAYRGMLRKCNVLIGTPAGVEAARAYKPLATYWTVPK